MARLETAASAQLRSPLEDESLMIEPRASLADLVLPAELRRRVTEVVDVARSKHTVLEAWGLNRRLTHSAGIAVLMHGPPGTGKTLCAEAVAYELGRPLTIVTAGDIRSKFCGEAEKRLKERFRLARAHDAVLFIDVPLALRSARRVGAQRDLAPASSRDRADP
jgi:SpoVK/Ycf46/Vps4 family AAA+-type ATPase